MGTLDNGLKREWLRLTDENARLRTALEKVKQLVLTNRTHSVLDEVQGVCDDALSAKNQEPQMTQNPDGTKTWTDNAGSETR